MPPLNDIVHMLLPLTNNFALKTITISSSRPAIFENNTDDNPPALSLNNVKLLVDGPILLP